MKKRIEEKQVLIEIPIDKINKGDRFRTDSFGDVELLAYNIEQHGLIHPIAVMKYDEPYKGFDYFLLAGERRLRAFVFLKKDMIPAKVYPSDLDGVEIRCIELYENILREDLSWQEETDLTAEIHNLQVQLYGEKRGDEGHSMRDTARLLHQSPAKVSLDIKLAEARKIILENPKLRKAFPGLDKAKTKMEAHKILDKGEHIIKQAKLAGEIANKMAKTPVELIKENMSNQYIVGDFFEESLKLKDRSFDIVEMDPPFGIDIHHKKHMGDHRPIGFSFYEEWDSNSYTTKINKAMKESYRLLKDGGWMIVWFGPEPWFETVYQAIIGAGFACKRIPGIWNKGGGQTIHADLYMANSYEMFFYARKGAAKLNRQGLPNIISYKPVASQEKEHITEKPVELYEDLISRFVGPGTKILVPFLGSGATLLAAANLKMQGIGYDLSKEHRQSYVVKVHEGKPGGYK